MKQRIAILGASGYTGREVLRILRRHPDLQPDLIMSARTGVEPRPPELSYDTVIEPLDPAKLQFVDGVFVCAPHGAAHELVQAALEAGTKVVDLSADFRLRDPEVYEHTYGAPHPAPDLLATAVYGLTEQARSQISKAQLVANPGCFPTAVALPLLPLLRENMLDTDADIIADCKSGVSGAGAAPKTRTHFGSVHENFLAYGIGTHRHTPEIHQLCGVDNIVFVPHLLPTFRGILATIYVQPTDGVTTGDLLSCLDGAYAGEPFIRLYDRGLPELNRVQNTNYCDIAARPAGGRRIAIVSAIDNLGKGAAGQAVQNMNLMLGLPEDAGLT